jgi:hypothetical protein
MALLWHGHFASNEAKVRDYRKLLGQLELFQEKGTGNFRDLTIAVAQDPAMLSFLDAGVNVKGASNENFAREIMELFTMGVGHYTEKDIREAARAFTGWNYVDTKFVVNKEQHDDGEKTFLGKTGHFDGVDVINIIMQQPVTADYIAGKIYRFFVRQQLSPELQKQLGQVLRDNNYELKPLLERIFLSRDFYSPASVGTQSALTANSGKRASPEFRTLTWRQALWGNSSSRLRRWRVGLEDKAGSRRVFYSNAPILSATCCFPTSASFPRIASPAAEKFVGSPIASGREWILRAPRWTIPRLACARSRT